MVDEPANGTGFSTKEMLVRIDAKVDVIAAKQAHYDVELALLKARQETQERIMAESARDYERLQSVVEGVGRKIAVATGALSAIIVAANWLVPAAVRHFLGG
jgi:hypothetical protein